MDENIVFWSGGLDSTLMAVDLMRANKYIKLVTCDNFVVGGAEQNNKEKITRKHILEKFKSEFGSKQFSHETFLWDGTIRYGVLNQASIWLSIAPLVSENKDKLYFGFIRYSDFWHYKHKFEKAFDNTCNFHGKKIELHYPLEWTHKKAIIKKLKKYGYYDLCYHSRDGIKQ